jgi:hypothetical protein
MGEVRRKAAVEEDGAEADPLDERRAAAAAAAKERAAAAAAGLEAQRQRREARAEAAAAAHVARGRARAGKVRIVRGHVLKQEASGSSPNPLVAAPPTTTARLPA